MQKQAGLLDNEQSKASLEPSHCSRCSASVGGNNDADVAADADTTDNDIPVAATGAPTTPTKGKFSSEQDKRPAMWDGRPVGVVDGHYVHDLAVSSPLGFKVQNVTSKVR